MVQISPKLILLSELVVGRAENQPLKECLLYPRKYSTSTQNELFRRPYGLTLCHQLFTFMADPPLPHQATPSHGFSSSSASEKVQRARSWLCPLNKEQRAFARRRRPSSEQETAASTLPLFEEQNHLLDTTGKTQSWSENRYQTNKGHDEISHPPGSAPALSRLLRHSAEGLGEPSTHPAAAGLRSPAARKLPSSLPLTPVSRGLLPAGPPKAGAA